ncbi:MAG: alanine--tRNA ligase, partial [Candidatus Marinimicrobia bacterium]|nr:alanine--tRNA ligase [Candidatus Neomarinimicrobiota bacterium]
ELVAQAVGLGKLKVVAAVVDIHDVDHLKDTAVDVKHKLKSAIVALGAVINEKPQIVVAVTEDLKDHYQAGKIVKELGSLMGGGGGGSAIMATAGGRDAAKLSTAVDGTLSILKEKFKR